MFGGCAWLCIKIEPGIDFERKRESILMDEQPAYRLPPGRTPPTFRYELLSDHISVFRKTDIHPKSICSAAGAWLMPVLMYDA